MIHAQSIDYSLQDLRNISQLAQNVHANTDLTIRQKAIKDAAMALGAQAGLRSIAIDINHFLSKNAAVLNKVYNFNALLLPHHILPPTVVANYNTSNLSDNAQSLSINGEAYHIIKPAKFVVNPPNWRDYLWMDYQKPKLPDASLFPKNDEEQRLWDKSINVAWQEGIKQGLSIFQTSMKHLTRDFKGMLLFKELVTKGMITMPKVAFEQNGITGDKRHLVIDNNKWQLSKNSSFNLAASEWKPVLSMRGIKHDFKQFENHRK
ncbi:type IV secretory system conjugative DNA transfer family protein [Facilibium subflavum]|uniref:type IV secretory system conjugative DNA transfer family protein n=1 Tax=Facilibium subflavum TaxID=2219058 RepID=UPI000E64A0F8|nr:type IV secretory system conjugative DNA transfer family protein [Facilibium subflavum]